MSNFFINNNNADTLFFSLLSVDLTPNEVSDNITENVFEEYSYYLEVGAQIARELESAKSVFELI